MLEKINYYEIAVGMALEAAKADGVDIGKIIRCINEQNEYCVMGTVGNVVYARKVLANGSSFDDFRLFKIDEVFDVKLVQYYMKELVGDYDLS